MNKGQIYATVAFVGLFQLLLILNRTIKTKHREQIDSAFCSILIFFAAFCLVDCLWGICDSKLFSITNSIFGISTYGYHCLCAFSAFAWYGYILSYMKCAGEKRKKFNMIRYILILIQLSMIFTNLFTNLGFSIDSNYEYHTGVMRLQMYLAQFLYYIVIILYTLIKIYQVNSEEKGIYKNALVFSTVPLIFGIGQYLFYDVAMYSMGFMLSAFIIYAFNLTEIREKHLSKVAEEMDICSKIDTLTGLLNRRAYEEYLLSSPQIPVEQDFVYISMDLNALKDVNDELGHEAGDEYISAAAQCMKTCFGSCGDIYRIGGDEFTAIIFANEYQLSSMKKDFEEKTVMWNGKLVTGVYVSCGYVTKQEMPNATISDISKCADERMYKAKESFYSNKGIDRRARMEAFAVITKLYKKILKINLTRDSFKIICMDLIEKNPDMGYSEQLSLWIYQFGISGMISDEDLGFYNEKLDINYLRQYFKSGETCLSLYYNRKNGDHFSKCILEIVPANDYSNENQSLFLYVKEFEKHTK